MGRGEEESGIKIMNKEDFIRLYLRPKVTIWFCEPIFKYDIGIIVRERGVTLDEVGSYYCPWYYNVGTRQELNARFEDILGDSQARAVMVRDVESKIESKSHQIQQYIKDFQGKTEKSLYPFPIATDITFNKSLVLDGNKTLVALYQSWGKDKVIPVAEIYGSNLISILPDFCVVYRS